MPTNDRTPAPRILPITIAERFTPARPRSTNFLPPDAEQLLAAAAAATRRKPKIRYLIEVQYDWDAAGHWFREESFTTELPGLARRQMLERLQHRSVLAARVVCQITTESVMTSFEKPQPKARR